MSLERQAAIFQHGRLAGHLRSTGPGTWAFAYEGGYDGPPVSLTLPVRVEPYDFPEFPAFLEGLLPEGPQLEALLRKHKIDRHDAFRQIVTVGEDLIGSLTVRELTENT
ncbi:MAG: HipA N-terminal domain-containing protein [Akkermansiaceae bacterium]|nr:HipA N-terminal domain-containing protein [Akkermansiaceae bacterium]